MSATICGFDGEDAPLFCNDPYLTIELDLKTDITGATAPVILFTRPDNTHGEWEATVSGTKVTYAPADDDIMIPGRWDFQAQVAMGSGFLRGGVITRTFQQPITS
jgi:hypothetical protein